MAMLPRRDAAIITADYLFSFPPFFTSPFTPMIALIASSPLAEAIRRQLADITPLSAPLFSDDAMLAS
jgi:hypothetical protein